MKKAAVRFMDLGKNVVIKGGKSLAGDKAD